MKNVYLYIFVMAFVTYIIRFAPLTFFRKKISNPYFKAFLNFVPFSVLGAMTIPDIFYSTGSVYSAIVGLVTAVVLSIKGKGLLSVSLIACVSVLMVELIIKFV